jgi:hypothetical protein
MPKAVPLPEGLLHPPNDLVIGSRRRCDNDGVFYIVKATNHRFCTDKCRQMWARYGCPYVMLRETIQPMIEQQVKIGIEDARASDRDFQLKLVSVMPGNIRDAFQTAFPEFAERVDELVLDGRKKQRSIAKAS